MELRGLRREIEQKPEMRVKSGRKNSFQAKNLELYIRHCGFGGEFFSTIWGEDPQSSHPKRRKGTPQIDGGKQMTKAGALEDGNV